MNKNFSLLFQGFINETLCNCYYLKITQPFSQSIHLTQNSGCLEHLLWSKKIYQETLPQVPLPQPWKKITDNLYDY